MSITQKYKEKEDDAPEQEGSDQESAPSAESSLTRPTGIGARTVDEKTPSEESSTSSADEEDTEEDDDEGGAAPTQLGARRFVYAAYFAGGIGIAFVVSKILDFAWLKLSQYKPMVGEPQQEVVMPVSALVGIAMAVYYWRRTRARELAEEVADELSKVTWPSKQEVTNGTAVVLVTTAVATIFFALMDRFWGFVTNLVYGS